MFKKLRGWVCTACGWVWSKLVGGYEDLSDDAMGPHGEHFSARMGAHGSTEKLINADALESTSPAGEGASSSASSARLAWLEKFCKSPAGIALIAALLVGLFHLPDILAAQPDALAATARHIIKMMITVFAITFGSQAVVNHFLAGSWLDQLLVPVFKRVVEWLGPYATLIAKACGREGVGASRFCANLLRTNLLLVLATTFIASVADIVRWIGGRITTRQLLKSVLRTCVGSLGGCYGYILGATLGTAILPGVGTFFGGLLFGWLGSALLTRLYDVLFDREEPGQGEGQILIPAH